MCGADRHPCLHPVPACIPCLSASLVWVNIPACRLVQVGIPGLRWRLPAVAVQSDTWCLSHGAFPPPRGIGENFQKWPKTCIGSSPTIVLPLLSYCPEVAWIRKCINNPEQQWEGGREAKTFRLSHPGVRTAAESQIKPKQCNPCSCYPAIWLCHCHYSFLPSSRALAEDDAGRFTGISAGENCCFPAVRG